MSTVVFFVYSPYIYAYIYIYHDSLVSAYVFLAGLPSGMELRYTFSSFTCRLHASSIVLLFYQCLFAHFLSMPKEQVLGHRSVLSGVRDARLQGSQSLGYIGYTAYARILQR